MNQLSGKKATILGIGVDKITFKEAVAIAKKLICSPGKHYVVTPNPEIIVAALRDPEFKKILNKADLSIPDGVGVVTLANIFGEGFPERVTGVDLLESLAGEAEKEGFSIFFLGGRHGVAEKTAKVLTKRYPKLKISGTFAGDGEVKGDLETLKKIGKRQIDILAIAYGPGKQEKWINRNLGKLNVQLAIGVGGALDFISGEKKRAPMWVQQLKLEWAFRLLQEPWRIKRQLALPQFATLFFLERIFKK